MAVDEFGFGLTVIGYAGHEYNKIEDEEDIKRVNVPAGAEKISPELEKILNSLEIRDEPQNATQLWYPEAPNYSTSHFAMKHWLENAWINYGARAGYSSESTDESKTKDRYNSLAKKRAREFLQSWLTEKEYEDLQTTGLFIKSKINDKIIYRVDKDAGQMIDVINEGNLIHKLCVNSIRAGYENDDTVLAKILLIKSNETQFLSIAQKWFNEINEITTGTWVDYSGPVRIRSRHNADRFGGYGTSLNS